MPLPTASGGAASLDATASLWGSCRAAGRRPQRRGHAVLSAVVAVVLLLQPVAAGENDTNATDLITEEDERLAEVYGVTATCPLFKECWQDVQIVQVTGCLDVWPSTVNCPPDGSLPLTIWGKGFGEGSPDEGPFKTTNDDGHGMIDSRVHAFIGGARCEDLRFYNATAYGMQAAVWEGHQILICNNYLGWEFGDFHAEADHGPGGHQGSKLTDRLGGEREKEGLHLPVTVVNRKDNINQTRNDITVSFAFYPRVHRIDNCGATNDSWDGCPTDGKTPLEIIGKYFIGYGGFGEVEVKIGPYSCQNVVVLNDTNLMCMNYPGSGFNLRVRVKANGVWDRSEWHTYMSYRPVPRVEQISGCYGQGMHTEHCSRAGDQTLTIIGYDLWVDVAMENGTYRRETGEVLIGGESCRSVTGTQELTWEGSYAWAYPSPTDIDTGKLYRKRGTVLRCHGYPWAPHIGPVGTNVTLKIRLQGELNHEDTSIMYSSLMIERVTGCMDFPPSTANCNSLGAHTITLHGKGFGTKGARVFFGPWECGTVTHGLWIGNGTRRYVGGEDTHLECSNYLGPASLPSYFPGEQYHPFAHAHLFQTSWSPPTVLTEYGINHTEPGVTVAFARRPEIHSVEGCTYSEYKNHTSGCYTNGTVAPITIRGAYFMGTLGFGEPQIWIGPHRCKKSVLISDTLMRCDESPGEGQNLQLEVRRGIVGTAWSTAYIERSGITALQPVVTKFLSRTDLPLAYDAAVWLNTNMYLEDIRLTYRFKPYVRSIAGCGCTADLKAELADCALESSNHTVLCPTKGETRLTLTGFNFGSKGASVWVGTRTGLLNKICENVEHDATSPDNIVYCWGYRYSGSAHKVTVVVEDEESDDPMLLSFVPSCPFWNSAQGVETIGTTNNGTMCNTHGTCDASCPSVPATCVCEQSDTGGFWDGYVCQDCKYGYWGADCKLPCSGGSALPCSGAGLCTGGIHGDGQCLCNDGVAGSQCEKPCPQDASRRVCGGFLSACSNGTLGTGECTCPDNDEDGHWSGKACSQCVAGWHSSCKVQCPGGWDNACSSRGSCDDGPTGNGTCTCAQGYAGLQCQIPCAGGPTNPCSFHGTCNALTGACTCYTDSTRGFWGGAACDVCAYGYSGPATEPTGCITKCPRNDAALVCADIGTCVVGECFCPDTHNGELVCGYSCNVTGNVCDFYLCPPGLYGQTCSEFCPGITYPDPNRPSYLVVCHGHGSCSAGKIGSGACNCQSGYAGTGCSIECAGGAANPCSAHGTCADSDGTCTCQSGYAAADCGTECKGGNLNPCTGHGTCSMGASGDGSCTCTYGYLGDDCSAECPGGAATPCNRHGNCTGGVCFCENNPEIGHWTGTACDSCLPDWFGANCLKTCPKDRLGQNCSNHGSCPTQVEFCNCDNDQDKGYWRGTICDQCKSGYWGADCKSTCPGGACAPCTGHGVCSEGVSGYGWCNCSSSDTDGWWAKADCSDCKQGWWGPECKGECPGGWISPCSSHGTCSDGSFGTGTCSCFSSAEGGGVWVGTVCDNCASGWYSSNCSVQCPFYPIVGGRVCGGHGTCNDGVAGSGLCVCADSYAGHACQNVCPKDAVGRICGGFLTACNDGREGDAACVCPKTDTQGYWAEPTCDDCVAGYGGSDCTTVCPGGSTNPCSGNGRCSDGVNGDGRCVCNTGYTGEACTLLCPGGTTSPCSGRGVCELDATCTCYASANLGFWAGEACTTCLTGYSGQLCKISCPTAVVSGSSQVCAGRGTCISGACYGCETDYCGDSCEIGGPDDPTACSAVLCPATGLYGPECTGRCPQTDFTTTPPTVCSGHGLCSDGKQGSGDCFCNTGYAGRGCSIECDGGAATPCSGHGNCNQTYSGKCTCDAYYAEAGCGVACPGLGTTAGVCSGHGLCSMGSTGDGLCRCTPGWAGLSCEKECNGGAANPCSGHGQCNAVTGLCTCIDSAVLGRFGGSGCESCKDGYFGETCLEVCPSGKGSTQGRSCVCNSGWASRDCSKECVGGASNPCSGNGKCNDTNSGDGTCTCYAGYRSLDCSKRCAGHAATGQECAGHGVCDAVGVCACYASKTLGHWAPPDCVTCNGDWFGILCDQFCPVGTNGQKCSGHGQCGALVGICECRGDSESGFWFGEACETCVRGYWGPECRNPCPGGACAPCNDHGVCSDGPTGTGICTCHATPELGYWTGSKCSDCAQGRWGKTCQAQCPGGVTPEAWCSGHGDCSQGTRGSGLCTCFSDEARGRWTGDVCADCLSGWYATNCSLKCPGAILPCSGRGVCDDKMAGSGRCTCYRGYAGEPCSVSCPKGPNGDFCSGAIVGLTGGVNVEACDWGAPGQLGKVNGGDGTCKCPGGTVGQPNRLNGLAYGFLTGDACERCMEGYAGSDCKTICPGVGGLGECTSHGHCEDGKSGTGTCICDSGYAGDACDVVCTGGTILPCNGRGTCQKGSVGPPQVVAGSCVCFASAELGYWAEPGCLDCDEGWSGQNCDKRCPTASGKVCSGHGECREGTCYCLTDDFGEPYCSIACELFGKTACSAFYCEPGTYGSGCQYTCPGMVTDAVTLATSACSAHGKCNDGKQGDGACACDVGWAGSDCNTECLGGAALPCSGYNGFCQQDGSCKCKSGFAGVDCSIPCAGGAGNPCRGHGVCDEGAELRGNPPRSGTGTCTCQYGYAGEDCGLVCPGGVDTPCNNNGQCEADGFCRCVGTPALGYWEGTACDSCRQGYYGTRCELPCVNGFTTNKVCICKSGFANANCSRECDGYLSAGYTAVCAGHGSCQEGNTGDGSCNCNTGYVGSYCNLLCPGQNEVCSGHGVCNPVTAACECDDNTDRGHWSGSSCEVCAQGWFGTSCLMTCASQAAHPILCSGHGECDPVKVQCICWQNVSVGYWAGHDCHKCSDGYWGSQCESECPGGSCNPCTGHGTCHDGQCPDTGCEQDRGSCNCTSNDVDGYWATGNCSECAFGYYSNLCDKFCPTGIGVTGVRSICSRRGTCSMGRLGNGQCDCEFSPASGYWGGSGCDTCWPGYWGSDCRYQCPGNIPLQGTTKTTPCSGHGQCQGGQSGTGVCECDYGHAGPGCGIACPQGKVGNMDEFAVCTSHGSCSMGVDGDGTCTCTTVTTKGHWQGTACSECVAGYWGPECLLPCPGNVANAQPCWNQGRCNDGVEGNGQCVCDFGYSRSDCSRVCDGGVQRPCNGRGECRPADGGCDCFRTGTQGYWAGVVCDTCLEGYSGGTCTLPCPTNSTATDAGAVCSGHGVCREGACYSCETGFCHGAQQACETSGQECLVDACGTTGVYGRDCNLACPGGIGAATCSGHGFCSDGKKGTGDCACDVGWTNVDCSQECPGPTDAPCNNQGVCVKSLGVDTNNIPLPGGCVCASGYARAACDRECPGGWFDQCSGHGVCSHGASQNGTCTCQYGYAGDACAQNCTGGSENPCTGHGLCSKVDGTCTCNSTLGSGYWGGDKCDRCQQGWYGVNCTAVCVHGSSVPTVTVPGSQCHCDQGYARQSCDFECPRGNVSGLICSGHGYCLDGSDQLGTCVCDTNYYTANCEVLCVPTDKCARPPTEFEHAQCNALTGECECQDNVDGHWDGTGCPTGANCKCDVCKLFYWGDNCDKECICSQHGGCDRNTGTCQCFQSDTLGYWAGAYCQQCADGYVGFDCMSPNVRISRTGQDLGPPVRFTMKVSDQGIILSDNDYELSYVGGQPLLVFDTTTDTMVFNKDLGGAVLQGWLAGELVHFMTDTNYIISFERGKADLDQAQWGQPVFVGVEAVSRTARRLDQSSASSTLGTMSPSKMPQEYVGWLNGTTSPPKLWQDLPSESGQEDGYALSIEEAIEVVEFERTHRTGRVLNIPLPRQQEAQELLRTRRVHSQQALSFKLVKTVDDTPMDLVYLVWTGELGRKIYYQQVSTMTLVRIVDVSNDLAHITDATLFAEFSLLCITGNTTQGTYEVLLINTASLRKTLVSRSYFLPDCASCEGRPAPCCSLASTPAANRRILYFSVRIDQGFKMVSLHMRTGAVQEYTTIQNMRTNNIVVTELTLDDLSGAGYAFAHIDSDPSTCYKFNLTSLRIFGTVAFLRTGSSVERILSADYQWAQRALLCMASLGSIMKIVKLNLFAVHSLTPAISDTRGGTVITVRGEGFAKIGLTCCKFGTAPNEIAEAAIQNTGDYILCKTPPDPTGDGGCGGQRLEVTLRGGTVCDLKSPGFSQNRLTVQRVPTPSIFSVSPSFGVYQGGQVVTVEGIGFHDSAEITCRWASRDELINNPPHGDSIYAMKSALFLKQPGHATHNLTFVNSFKILCRQPPSVGGQASKTPAYLEVTLDGQLPGYSTSQIQYAIYGEPAGIKPTQASVTVRSDLLTTIPPMTVQTVDSSDHWLLQYDQTVDRIPIMRSISMELVDLSPDSNSNQHKQVQWIGESHAIMRGGEVTFGNVSLRTPPSGSVRAKFTHKVITFTLNETSGLPVPSDPVLWEAWVLIQVISGRAVALHINREPSNVSNHASELPLTVQPEIDFFDPANNTVTQPETTTIGVVAEWEAFVWTKTSPGQNSSCSGLCPCTANMLKSLNYSWVPSDTERCWNEGKSTQDSEFMDKFGKVVFRTVTLVGYHSVLYRLRFRVSIPPELGSTIVPVRSRDIEVGSCQPAEQRYGREFSDACLACPANMRCNGTIHVKPALNFWRPNNASTIPFPCGSHGPCLPDNATCNITMCINDCSPGHRGVTCSACEKGYGKSSTAGECTLCPPQEETNALLAVIIFAVVLVLVAVVHSNLKIKPRREMDLPILTKMLISHLQISSRIGEFKTEFPGVLSNIYQLQQSSSSFSFQGSFIDCAGGGGMSQYPKFLAYMFMPVGVIVFSFFLALAIIYIRKLEDAIQKRKRRNESERRIADRKRKEGERYMQKQMQNRQTRVVVHRKTARDDSEDTSDDEAMNPRKLARADMQGVDPANYEDEYEEDYPPEKDVKEVDMPEQVVAAEQVDVEIDDGHPAATPGAARPSLKHTEDAKRYSVRRPTRRNTEITSKKTPARKSVDDFRELRDKELRELAKKDELTDEQRSRMERKRKFTTTWLLAFIIVLYFIYPNLIQESSQMLLCKKFHWEDDLPHRWNDSQRPEVAPYTPGVGREESYLSIDLSISCNDAEYRHYYLLAVTFALGYGIGIPVLAAGIVRVQIMRSSHGFQGAVRQFGFLLMGYKPNRWYWEAVVMVRKLTIVFTSVFIEDAQLQTYVAMWAMTVALVVHMYSSPYDHKFLTNLEAFSLACIIITLNFSLLYHWELEPLYKMGVTFVIALLTLSVVLAFVYFIVNAFVQKALRIINQMRRRLQAHTAAIARKSIARLKSRIGSVVSRGGQSTVYDPARPDTAFASGSNERPITHSSMLPNFDRITMLNRLYVLRGGQSTRLDAPAGEPWAGAAEPSEHEEDQQPHGKQVPPEEEWWHEDVRKPSPRIEPEAPPPIPEMPSPTARDRLQKGMQRLGGDLVSPQTKPLVTPSPESGPAGAPHATSVGTEEQAETSRDSMQFDLGALIADIGDSGVSENTRFTRRQAKEEALEGNVVHAAYMFCHLRPEGVKTVAGIHDDDAVANLDNMAFGRRYAREFAKLGRGIDEAEFNALWEDHARQYLSGEPGSG